MNHNTQKQKGVKKWLLDPKGLIRNNSEQSFANKNGTES